MTSSYFGSREFIDDMKRAGQQWAAEQAKHDACRWEQAGPFVHCTDHGTRLYQGDLPGAKSGAEGTTP